MRIVLNGRPHDIAERTTLTQLLELHVGTTRGSAVVVDDEVVPRASWPALVLAPDQRVELLTAVQGG